LAPDTFGVLCQSESTRGKKAIAVASVIAPGFETATLESAVGSRMGTNHSSRVFLRALSRRERFALRASLWFLMDSPFGAYCCSRKQFCSFSCSFRKTTSSLPLKDAVL